MRAAFVLFTNISMSGAVFATSCIPTRNERSEATADGPESQSPSARQQWAAGSGAERIHQVTDLNTQQLRALPRDRTVVLLSGAYIGQHGPYLPCVDCFRNERLAQELASAIAQRPGWHVLTFPFIPLGQGSLEEFGARSGLHPAFVVRADTLRAIFMDLASHLGEQGFRWVLVINSHGAPHHLRALDLAGDYFHDTYGGNMVHLTGLFGLDQLDNIARSLMTQAERDEDGLGIHASMVETSEALYLRPDLVNPAYKQAPALTLRGIADITEFATKEDWPGYFGSPRLASASLGEAILKEYSARLNRLALEILDGRDHRQMPRMADEILKAIPVDSLQHERALATKQENWLKGFTGRRAR